MLLQNNFLIVIRHINFNIIIKFATIIISLAATHLVFSQAIQVLNPDLAPFYHGVASGDPMHDRVIIWTRISIDDINNSDINVSWKIATDTLFNNVVNYGTVSTNESKDYTVKVDVTGLNPDTWYYYCFDYEGQHSIIGRTRTLPVLYKSNFRFTVFSGAQYQKGFFNAYRTATLRNDFDAVIHLGDYIYEHRFNPDIHNPNRMVLPDRELINLTDYRERYYHYRLDSDLMFLHQQYPWFVIWDDHETANNSFKDGAQAHNSSIHGFWENRSKDAIQAYTEWLPIREINPHNQFEIYRMYSVGDLFDIFFLETRLLYRDNQELPNDSPDKTMLGETQLNWLLDNLSSSDAQWKIIAQPVCMAPVEIPIYGVLNNDQWDGYQVEREKIFKHIYDNEINNVVVLSGDIHSSWANNLRYNPPGVLNFPENIAVEFVTTSVTSTFPLNYVGQEAGIIATNLHVRYLNTQYRGYYLLDIREEKASADWRYVYTTDTISNDEFCATSWHVDSGIHNSLASQDCGIINPIYQYPNLAPKNPFEITTSISKKSKKEYSVYPNPTTRDLFIEIHSNNFETITCKIARNDGAIISDFEFKNRLNKIVLNNSFKNGVYFLLLTNSISKESKTIKIIKQ